MRFNLLLPFQRICRIWVSTNHGLQGLHALPLQEFGFKEPETRKKTQVLFSVTPLGFCSVQICCVYFVLCKFVVFKTHDRVLLYFVQTTKFCPSFFSDQKPIIEFQLDYGAMIDFLFFVIVVKYIGVFEILSSLFKTSYFTALYIQQTNAPCWNMDKQIVKILSYLGFFDIMDCFRNLEILWGMVKP